MPTKPALIIPPEMPSLISFKDGSAGASSSLAGHSPNQAFELGLWKSLYHPWANLNTAKFPHTVWYKFPKAIEVGKFEFSSRGRCCLEQAPLEFQFVGSNDCKTWTTIQSYQTKFTKLNEVKSWTIPASSRRVFQCYGIKVTKVSSGVYASIKHFKMWTMTPISQVLTAVSFKGGKAGASSSLAGWSPNRAFELGAYLPWVNLNTAKFPHTVW